MARRTFTFLIVIVLIALMAWFLLPPLSTTPQYVRDSIESAGNLKTLYQAMANYAADNGGYFPDRGFYSLHENGYLDDLSILRKPTSEALAEGLSSNEIIGSSSYVYLGTGKRVYSGKETSWDVLILEPINNDKCANIGFTSGRVKAFKRDDWNDICDRSKVPEKYKIK